jgi:4-amino-4-deoxy-L-arabinose transferase-like glycosyltransferase
MINRSFIRQTLPFYLFAAGVFLIIVCQDLFSNGMFLDGLIYSTVSRNLADGTGTFWNPYFTATFLSDFHEHPPLAFGLQSIFFTILGDSRFIDRFYSLVTILFTAFVILKIWNTLGYKYGWFPLFLWLLTPTVSWSSCNNLLENTLQIFTSLSILFYLKYQDRRKYIFIIFSGIMLALGFLTKGFVAFFPWTFPFFLWVMLREKSFSKMAIDSIGIFIFTVVPLLLLVLLIPDARLSLHKYFDNQVVNSLKNVITVDSRFYIVKRLFSELIPSILLSVLIISRGWYRKYEFRLLKTEIKKASVFILLGLAGVLPVMISMKQSGFYILPAYPFFMIGFGILLYPLIDFLFADLNYRSGRFLFFKYTGYVVFFLGIILSILFSGGFSRDKNKIEEIKLMLPELPKGTIINVSPVLYSDFSLHGYFFRFKNVSLDPENSNKREFLLLKRDEYSDTPESDYQSIGLKTKDYLLLRKK